MSSFYSSSNSIKLQPMSTTATSNLLMNAMIDKKQLYNNVHQKRQQLIYSESNSSPQNTGINYQFFLKFLLLIKYVKHAHLIDEEEIDEDEQFNEDDTMVSSSASKIINNYGNGASNQTSKEEKRRLSHTAAEQKRRDAIKRGYDELQHLCPNCDLMDPSSSQKVCKATVLKRCKLYKSHF